MFTELFGSVTAGRVLVYIAKNGEAYTREIAAAFEVSPQMVHEQLLRFERGGLMTSRRLGSLRLFAFDPSHPVGAELLPLLQKGFESLSPEEQDRVTRKSRPGAKKSRKPTATKEDAPPAEPQSQDELVRLL